MIRRSVLASTLVAMVAVTAACSPRFAWADEHDAAPRGRLMRFVVDLQDANYPGHDVVLTWNNARLLSVGDRACRDLDRGADPIGDLVSATGLPRPATARIAAAAVRELCPRNVARMPATARRHDRTSSGAHP